MAGLIVVTAAIVWHDGRVLIARRAENDRMAGLWEFPGGKIEAGETPEQCLKRELFEELAMNATIGSYLGHSVYRDGSIAIDLQVYRAFWDGLPIRRITHQAFRWVSPAQLSRYAFTPADRPFVRRLIAGDLLADQATPSRGT